MKTNLGYCYLYKLYSVLAFAMPLGLLFGLNYEAYIKTTSTSLSSFGFLIVALVVLVAKDKLLAFMKDNFMLSLSLGLFIVSLIMYVLVKQLMLISAVAIGASILSEVFDRVARIYHSYAYSVDSSGNKTPVSKSTLSQKNAWRLAYGQPIQSE